MFGSADTWIANPYDPQSLNRYGYVLNNPLRYSDPTGRRACEAIRSRDVHCAWLVDSSGRTQTGRLPATRCAIPLLPMTLH